jgi:hypothetical protein
LQDYFNASRVPDCGLADDRLPSMAATQSSLHERFDCLSGEPLLQREGQEFTSASEAEVRAHLSNIVAYVKSIQQK